MRILALLQNHSNLLTSHCQTSAMALATQHLKYETNLAAHQVKQPLPHNAGYNLKLKQAAKTFR
jgi:hypothetical protein